ncbi:hypothetical protein H310_03323 [Aphanomyces invadans]|uniref:PPPDE domain-containing protein n=1 Tax=Aphanomyces invadans TaxID=157072 RepID=A0A024UH06_9STRA|nr:hypothetical protein H310_03323 [Aphanomyces invadans]ETW05579.1 hypothetical protein H310_03323 [Aphanomyces invadans]|eukprot:XP_008865356.1 hypothetical protein H310_03323 [Aphanomyces invadans]
MYEVVLHVYDLTRGMARQMSPALLGRQIDGVWHTGIMVYEKEYFFGGGIQAIHPSYVVETYGQPVQVLRLGSTQVPPEEFNAFLHEVSPRFTAATYNLLTNNCNNFSNEVALFLVGSGIPQHILDLPNEVLSTPMGAMFRPMIEQMQANMAVNVQSHGGGNPFLASTSLPPPPSRAAASVPGPSPFKSLDSYVRPVVSGEPTLHFDRILANVTAFHSFSAEELAAFQRLATHSPASLDAQVIQVDRSLWWQALVPVLTQNTNPFMALCLLRAVLAAEVALNAPSTPDAASSVIAWLVDHVDQASNNSSFSSALRIVYLSSFVNLLAAPSTSTLLAPHALRFLPFVWSTWHQLPPSHPAATVAAAAVFNFTRLSDVALDWTVQFTVVGGIAESLDVYASTDSINEQSVERLIAALGRLLQQCPSARPLAGEVGLVHVLARLKPRVAATTHAALAAHVLSLI